MTDDWVNALVDAFNSHDAAAVGEFMTADVEFVFWSGDAWATHSGRDAVVSLLKSFDREWSSDFSLTKTFAVVTEHAFAVE